ncbi:unnamed protein product [Albugo candida]|uniref:BPL/LPL catalytic domain-containing protein n=1 Tax=Albugo candida TaxID=65357 RepID=A0A024G8X1_9STRA|nr:unnamed protein product [Albugo candida]|eukprot:CCI42975.1 unnamed protein product [Albugo candida]
MSKIGLNYLRLRGVAIEKQLEIEEALFRVGQEVAKPTSNDEISAIENFFIYNDKAPGPAIVMGMGGKAERLVDIPSCKKLNIPVLKRFTGGGTVIVDENTIFASFLCSTNKLPHVLPFPRNIMKWSETFYEPFFKRLCPSSQFRLQEDDYVIGDRKCGGNAQSIGKNRWVHHTSFLWDYDPIKMQLLHNPARQPKYREHRTHQDFLVPLRELVIRDWKKNEQGEIFGSEVLAQAMRKELELSFNVRDISLEQIQSIVTRPHRKVTKFVSY